MRVRVVASSSSLDPYARVAMFAESYGRRSDLSLWCLKLAWMTEGPNDVLDYRVLYAFHYMTRWSLPRVAFFLCDFFYLAM